MSVKNTSDISFSTVAELYKRITDEEKIQVVDVRETSEYEGKRIKGAVSAPLSKFNESSKLVDKDRHSYIVCQSGKRAAKKNMQTEFAVELRELVDHKLYLPKPYRFNDALYDWPQPEKYFSNSPKIELSFKARNDWPGDNGIDGLVQALVGVSSFMTWKKITVAQWVFNDDEKLEKIYISILE